MDRNSDFDRGNPTDPQKPDTEYLCDRYGVTEGQLLGLWQEFEEKKEQEAEARRQEAQEQAEYDKWKREEEKLAGVERVAQDNTGYNLTPEEAQSLIDKITSDPKHPYLNDKASPLERSRAVAYVQRLYEIKAGKETSIEGWLEDFHKEREERIKELAQMDFKGEHSSASGQRASYNDGLKDSERKDYTQEGNSGNEE